MASGPIEQNRSSWKRGARRAAAAIAFFMTVGGAQDASIDGPTAPSSEVDTPTHGPLRPVGNLVDSDGDLVPDEFDNCTQIANGPQQGSNQVDTDRDGYGNACDADYSGAADFEVTTADFTIFLYAFTGTRENPETDHDGDGETTASDMSIFLSMFQQRRPLGPGLPCAGMEYCLP